MSFSPVDSTSKNDWSAGRMAPLPPVPVAANSTQPCNGFKIVPNFSASVLVLVSTFSTPLGSIL